MLLSLAQYSCRAPRLLAPKCSSALPLLPCSPATGSASDGRPSKIEGSPSSENVVLISKWSLARKVLHLIFNFALAIRDPLYVHTVCRHLSALLIEILIARIDHFMMQGGRESESRLNEGRNWNTLGLQTLLKKFQKKQYNEYMYGNGSWKVIKNVTSGGCLAFRMP